MINLLTHMGTTRPRCIKYGRWGWIFICNMCPPGSWYKHLTSFWYHDIGYFEDDIIGLAQDCSNSIASALELLLSCTNPSICNSHTFPKYAIYSVTACLWHPWSILYTLMHCAASDTHTDRPMSSWWLQMSWRQIGASTFDYGILLKWLKSTDNDGWTAQSRQTPTIINAVQGNGCGGHEANRYIGEGLTKYNLTLEPLRRDASCASWVAVAELIGLFAHRQKQMDTCTFWIPHILQTSHFAHHILDIAHLIHCIFCTPRMWDTWIWAPAHFGHCKSCTLTFLHNFFCTQPFALTFTTEW